MTNWNMRTEPLELKDGSTIKNYHYEFNSTDRVVAKIVEDVFKAIMDISADRKTEQAGDNLSAVEDEPLTCDGNCWMKKQNGEWLCEHCQREPKDEPNSSEIPNNCEDLQDWKDRMWAEAIVTEPTISKMEQVEEDINVRSKDEPQTEQVGVPFGLMDEATFKEHCLNCQRDTADIKCLDCDGNKYFLPYGSKTDCPWK